MDKDTESSFINNRSDWDVSSFLEWKDTMYKSLQTFGMRNKEFQFRKCANSSSRDRPTYNKSNHTVFQF